MSDAAEDRQSHGSVLGWISEKLLIPAVLVMFTIVLTAWWTNRSNDRHDIAITTIREDNAVDAVYSQPRGLEDAFLVFSPVIESPATPATEFSYTILIRNGGDFSETNLVADIGFMATDPNSAAPLVSDFDASTNLLLETVSSVDSTQEAPSLALQIPRLNPGEWISFRTTWNQSMEVNIEVRSDAISERDSTE